MSDRPSRSPERRRRLITAYVGRSRASSGTRMSPLGSSRPRFISSSSWAAGIVDAWTRYLIAILSAYSGVVFLGAPSMPKIPDMITSSVTACMRGAIGNGSPIGQRSISRSVMSEIICA